jgi:glycosyltransferase involved in cell wall biosynthesis
MRPPSVTLFTIASKNYLAYVRVLLASVATVHPEYRLVLCLADRGAPELHGQPEPFEIVQADAIGIPTFDDMVLRYDIMEFNTAVKPYMIRWLFDRSDTDIVIYLDPDIRVYSPLLAIEACFERGASVVLTPHLTQPLEDGKTPNDHHMLQAGVFNLGFIAVRRCAQSLRFIDWWARRLATQAVSDIRNNLFTDQRWCDLAPCFLDDLAVLKDPGCNVAYWNLAERRVQRNASGEWEVNGRPLAFFHFSGVNVARRHLVSKHQDRFTWDNVGHLKPLFEAYFDELLARGIETTRAWPYAYARWKGVELSPVLRQFYRQIAPQPPAAGHAGNWLEQALETEPGMPQEGPARVTRLMYLVHQLRPDLQQAFSLGTAAGREQFCRWFAQAARDEYGLPAALVPAPGAVVTAAEASSSGASPAAASRRTDPLAANAAFARLARGWAQLPAAAREHFAPGWNAALSLLARPASVQGDPAGAAGLSPVMQMVWASRPDLQQVFELRSEHGRRQFGHWFHTAAADEYGPHIHDALDVWSPAAEGARSTSAQEVGTNLVGYARAEIGMGEHVRMTAAALQHTDLPFGVINVHAAGGVREQGRLDHGELIEQARHPINLIHVNADQMLHLYGQQGSGLFGGRYNIGYWAWELPRWPDAWRSVLGLVQEVWAPSTFIRDAVAAVTDLPVKLMPLCVSLPPVDARLGRRHFGLPDDAFHFLYVFDAQSFLERKNPKAAVAAFRQAFPRGTEPVRLVLKTMNARAQDPRWQQLLQLVQEDPRITLMQQTLTRAEVLGLYASCDAFVSLHRSEGFGRGPAEAMYLGKPVIATGYSGNLDFTTERTAALVEHHLVPVCSGEYPMHEGQVWAEPDVAHAARLMRTFVEDPARARALGAAGRAFVLENLNPIRIGGLYAARLRDLGRAA